MAQTFFPSFLMLDPPEGSFGLRATSKEPDGQLSASESEAKARAVFARAFRQALEATPAARAAPDLALVVADLVFGSSVVLQLKPGLSESQREAVRFFLERVVHISSTLDESRLEAAIGKLAEVLLPDEVADSRGPIASDNLELRDRFVAQIPQFTSVEVGTQAGAQTKNPYATAARWKKSGDIFSIQHRGREFFPAFQFREGRPHPMIKKALSALPQRLSPWQRALWFVSTNGWLGGKAPVDVLDHPEAVLTAADREGEEVIG